LWLGLEKDEKNWLEMHIDEEKDGAISIYAETVNYFIFAFNSYLVYPFCIYNSYMKNNLHSMKINHIAGHLFVGPLMVYQDLRFLIPLEKYKIIYYFLRVLI
jgi:hypothetical protein